MDIFSQPCSYILAISHNFRFEQLLYSSTMQFFELDMPLWFIPRIISAKSAGFDEKYRYLEKLLVNMLRMSKNSLHTLKKGNLFKVIAYHHKLFKMDLKGVFVVREWTNIIYLGISAINRSYLLILR